MSTVTLTDQFTHTHEMPGVTTAKYAAKRIASYWGWEEDRWWLLANSRGEVMADDRLVSEFEETTVRIGLPRTRG
jgi:hypothetical protein